MYGVWNFGHWFVGGGGRAARYSLWWVVGSARCEGPILFSLPFLPFRGWVRYSESEGKGAGAG
ncbi:hypothetical protein CCUS01_03894 [Colletotrichum cuscutae]|uniref:Uncharacterized protein n=1 Tax=Colletotrichum cuscutae TaxID=1209917 RepID=A0AAI9VDZ7_9PEZI|nr:hypothetical protein CCUS01_03894 [Colletotrichum cuscutae]